MNPKGKASPMRSVQGPGPIQGAAANSIFNNQAKRQSHASPGPGMLNSSKPLSFSSAGQIK